MGNPNQNETVKWTTSGAPLAWNRWTRPSYWKGTQNSDHSGWSCQDDSTP